jgi:hypothetical protein
MHDLNWAGNEHMETNCPARDPIHLAALLLAFCGVCGQMASARDVFVVLSGGDSPFENNYSQYLQARAVVASFKKNYPPDSVWVFFGAGNIEGRPPLFGDVRREVRRAGLTLDSWVAGALPHNHPARREAILQAFRKEILPAVAPGGTLYLFVGDHGSRSRGKSGESIINLWSLERDPSSEHGWRSNEDEVLGVAELRRVLLLGLGKGRVVFCMTQCHAGGFHFLAVPHAMTPNSRWFTVAPDWAGWEQPLLARAAGFTATDEFSPAAGCDPAPNSDDWVGYERFIPEKMFGIDLFSLQRTGKPARSFAEAHVAATLEDRTIDKPYSTSEQYLERWANLIETRLAKEPSLTGKVKKCLDAYQRTVNGAYPKISDRALVERQTLFRRFIEAMIKQNPAVRDLLLNGTCQELEAVAGHDRAEAQQRQDSGQPRRRGRRRGRAATEEARRLWRDTVRPAWQTAVENRRVNNLPGAAMDFESYLLSQESEGRDYFFAGARSRMQEEIFWHSGYSDPKTLNPAIAEAVARWGVERRTRILAWAKAEDDEALRVAADKLSQQVRPPRTSDSEPANQRRVATETMSKETAAERTLFYRRVLAAWEFLIAVNERPALSRLRELTELERTPLPLPKS